MTSSQRDADIQRAPVGPLHRRRHGCLAGEDEAADTYLQMAVTLKRPASALDHPGQPTAWHAADRVGDSHVGAGHRRHRSNRRIVPGLAPAVIPGTRSAVAATAAPATARTLIFDFKAVVSCMSVRAQGAATVVNLSTGPFAASMEGDSRIEARVGLPRPCIAPIVFVTSPTGAWFADTGS